MTNKLDMFKCDLCGQIIEVFIPAGGDLVCCGEAMKHLVENTVDASKEKHVPVIEKVDGGYLVKIGTDAHPMEDKHYIQWIELIAGDFVIRKMLNPGDKPEAVFRTDASKVTAREYCNLHGLWKIENLLS